MKKAKREKVVRRFTEKGLCNWCGTPLTGRRTVWCSEACQILADHGLARVHVFRRDQGVCVCCGEDTRKLAARLERYRNNQESHEEFWRLTNRGVERERRNEILKRLSRLRRKRWLTFREELSERGFDLHRREFWDMDHIHPVKDGGGNDLDNLQTLCQPCHKKKTGNKKKKE